MSALFRARVENIQGLECQIRLYIIHPDQTRFYASQSFALQLIWDATRAPDVTNEQSSPLALEISIDEICDPQYVIENQDKYIELVRYLEYKNYPRTVNFEEMTEEEFDAYWKNEEGLPQALLLIQVTDLRWIAHLSNGLVWDTSAYNI
jgi:hypothetical protein